MKHRHAQPPGEKETSDLHRNALALPNQSVAMLFAASGNPSSWRLLGRNDAQRQAELSLVWWRHTTREHPVWNGNVLL